MSEWSGGYNVDLGYTYGFYRELAPRWLDFAALVQGVSPPRGRWRYLELGCGQGVGLTILAALHPGHDFVGIDFNPLHIAHARNFAASAGLTNVRFEEADFVDLAAEWPSDWGVFDYVSAHGIYTWLARPVRKGLVGTIGKATSPGALVYLSYNTLPGWIATYPVQHLLRLWQTSEELASVTAIETGIKRLKALAEAKTGLTQSLPGMVARVENMSRLDRSYLVQEYLHDNWHPMWFDEVAQELTAAKLVHVGTATIGDFYAPNLLPKERKEILAQYKNPIVRQVMLDVLVNQSFRRDVFARGNPQLWPGEQRRELLGTSVALLRRPSRDEHKFKLSVGEVNGKAEVYEPLYDALAEGPKTVEELMRVPGARARGLRDTLQAVALMLTANHIALDNPVDRVDGVLRLNRAIAGAVSEGAPYRYLAAGKIGAVVSASDADMLFLALSLEDPEKSIDHLAMQTVDRLLLLGRGLAKDGKPLTTRETMLPHARELAEEFRRTTLPQWRSLGVL